MRIVSPSQASAESACFGWGGREAFMERVEFEPSQAMKIDRFRDGTGEASSLD